MKIAVTGGAGFIGSHVAEACLGAGHEVLVLDDLSSGKRHQVPAAATFHQVDIQDPAVKEIFARERPEILIHHAAQMDVRRSVAEPAFDARVNILGLINLLEAGRVAGLRRVLFASSGGAAYGEQDEFPAPETHRLEPVSPYGVSKRAGELYLSCFGAMYGLEWVAMRYANVYGRRRGTHDQRRRQADAGLRLRRRPRAGESGARRQRLLRSVELRNRSRDRREPALRASLQGVRGVGAGAPRTSEARRAAAEFDLAAPCGRVDRLATGGRPAHRARPDGRVLSGSSRLSEPGRRGRGAGREPLW